MRWRTAVATVGPSEPPFLIEHEYAGAEWGDAVREARAAFEHPRGGRIRLTRLEVPCEQAVAAASAYERSVGLRFAVGDGGVEARVGAQVVRLGGHGAEPTVVLVGDPPSHLDLVRVGIRWQCVG